MPSKKMTIPTPKFMLKSHLTQKKTINEREMKRIIKSQSDKRTDSHRKNVTFGAGRKRSLKAFYEGKYIDNKTVN